MAETVPVTSASHEVGATLSLPPPSLVYIVQRPQVYSFFTTSTIHSMPLVILVYTFSFCAPFGNIGNITMNETTFTGTVLHASQHCGRVS